MRPQLVMLAGPNGAGKSTFYRTYLADLGLPFLNADVSAERVASRVKAGGHDVPLEKILARFSRTLDNLERAIIRLPRVTVYDNSAFDHPYRLIAEFRNGQLYRRAKGPLPKWARRYFSKGNGGTAAAVLPRG